MFDLTGMQEEVLEQLVTVFLVMIVVFCYNYLKAPPTFEFI